MLKAAVLNSLLSDVPQDDEKPLDWSAVSVKVPKEQRGNVKMLVRLCQTGRKTTFEPTTQTNFICK